MFAATTERTALRLATAVVVLAGLIWHLYGITRPFGAADVNAGLYLGPFAKQWEAHGWLALRGLPITPQLIHEIGQGTLYMQHPPGWLWATYLPGTSEAAMRIPSLLVTIAGAVALLHLLVRALGVVPATAAALAFTFLPVVSQVTQVSLESPLYGFGLMFLLATVRLNGTDGAAPATGAARRGWRALQLASGFCGPWADWTFAWYCAGVVALVPWRTPRTALRELVVPAIAVLASVALILLWRDWAFAHPAYVDATRREGTVGELIRSTVLKRPDLSTWITGCARHLALATTSWIPMLALPGLVVLLARPATRWLLLGLAIPGLLHPIVLADHATFHVHFYAYLAPALLAGCVAPAAHFAGAMRVPGLLIAAATVAAAFHGGVRMRITNDTTIFRDVGAAMTAAVVDGDRRNLVGTNFHPYPFPYYLRRPEALAEPIHDWQALEAGRKHTHYAGIRFFWFRVVLPDGTDARPTETAALKQYLDLGGFRKTRRQDLEQTFHLVGNDAPNVVAEAYEYEIHR